LQTIRLWRSGRVKLLGYVTLDDGHLTYEFDDAQEQDHVQEVFDQTGDVTWAWTRLFGEGGWEEHRAEPCTPEWLWFVVANILYPMGYQADFGVTE
jgi:hypothetical protein